MTRKEDNMIRKVDYFAMQIPNRAGEAHNVLGVLRKAKVNLLAFTGFPSGRGSQVDFVPADTRAFLKAARAAGWKVGKSKSGFLIQGKDKPGALDGTLARLARAKINVTAVDGVAAGGRRFGAILWVKAGDVAKAAKALRAR
jgi:hypothetical protein